MLAERIKTRFREGAAGGTVALTILRRAPWPDSFTCADKPMTKCEIGTGLGHETSGQRRAFHRDRTYNRKWRKLECTGKRMRGRAR